MNHGQDDKESIEDKMKDDHLYRVLDKDTWMIDIIQAIRKMPLDHLDKNSQRRIISESRKYFWDCETWVPLVPHRPGSRPFPTSGSGLPEDSPTCQWAQPT
jgi:hypothetical protein